MMLIMAYDSPQTCSVKNIANPPFENKNKAKKKKQNKTKKKKTTFLTPIVIKRQPEIALKGMENLGIGIKSRFVL